MKSLLLNVCALLFFASPGQAQIRHRHTLNEIELSLEYLNRTDQLELEEFVQEWESALKVAGHRSKASDPIPAEQRLDIIFGVSPAHLRQRQCDSNGHNYCFTGTYVV